MQKQLLFATLAVVALMGAGCAKQSGSPVDSSAAAVIPEGPIKLGFVGPLTGDAATLGQDALAAAQIAVEEVNAAGGVQGHMLELIAEDGKCNPKDAASAGTKLLTADDVTAIVGGLCSGETTAIAPMAEQDKTVLFSGCSSAPNITTAGDYIFRSYPSDAFQGKFAADYVYNTLGKKKVAVVATLGDYGTGIKNIFIESFEALGGEVVLAEDFAQESRDFRTLLTKIKQSDAEVVFAPSFTEAAIELLRQSKELGVTQQFFAADAWDDPKIHANSFAEGVMFSIGKIDLSNEEFKAKLAEKNASLTVCAPGYYDNVKVLAQIMGEVGTDREKIKNALYTVKDYKGLANTLTIDQNGDPVGAQYDVKVVKDGVSSVVAQ